jgi:hypothetical protein
MSAMTTTQIIVVAVVAVVAIALIAYLVARQQRTRSLRTRFGPEYERTVDQFGSQARAESVLAEREKRVQRLAIRPLGAEARSRYSGEWKTLQTRFVDDPAASIGAADGLVGQVMTDRGYPVGDFEQRAADISVDHPDVVEHYRVAHDIARRHRERPTTTEELRKAFLHYRALFGSLLETEPDRAERTVDRETEEQRTEVTR